MKCENCGHNVGTAMYLNKKCGKCGYNVQQQATRQAIAKLARDLNTLSEVQ